MGILVLIERTIRKKSNFQLVESQDDLNAAVANLQKIVGGNREQATSQIKAKL